MSGDHCSDDLDNFHDFTTIDKALIEIGMGNEERIKIYKILAAILHLGNVIFVENPLTGGCQIADSTQKHFYYAAQLLNMDSKTLEINLLTRKMEVTGCEPIVLVRIFVLYIIYKICYVFSFICIVFH